MEDILVIGLCTIVCGGEDFTDMENLGIEEQEWLRTFLALPNGIPDSDTFRRVFEKVDPQELSEVLHDWLDFYRKKRSVRVSTVKQFEGARVANTRRIMW